LSGSLVHESVVDDRDAIRHRIARDLRAALGNALEALIDDHLYADLRQRARDIDLVVVGRHRESVQEVRLPDHAEGERVGLLGWLVASPQDSRQKHIFSFAARA
jgi:hypothetical protein